MPDPTRLVVLYGGRSAEHEVSCVSAEHVLKAIDPARYDVTTVKIDKDGHWEGGDPFAAVRDADVPYVGCGVLSSALAMDKVVAKQVLAVAGIPQVRSTAVRHGVPHALDGVDLPWPRFVKPANMGSSVGVSKVSSPDELAAALELAFLYDEWVLVEEGVTAREVECAVLGGLDPVATRLGEIVPAADFYDYEDKYSGAGAELFIPADVPDAVHEEARALAVRAFEALRCDGLARVDFFYEEGGRGLLVNEINTMPGFTPYSMYPQLWAAEGLEYPALVDRLVELALERHARRAGHLGRPG